MTRVGLRVAFTAAEQPMVQPEVGHVLVEGTAHRCSMPRQANMARALLCYARNSGRQQNAFPRA